MLFGPFQIVLLRESLNKLLLFEGQHPFTNSKVGSSINQAIDAAVRPLSNCTTSFGVFQLPLVLDAASGGPWVVAYIGGGVCPAVDCC